MNYRDLVDAFLRGWSFTRSETIAILTSLGDEQLRFRPSGPSWQSLYSQFGCIARTQWVYTQAVMSGRMDFTLFDSPSLPRHDADASREEILRFLNEADKEWIETVLTRQHNEGFVIQWPAEEMPLLQHVAALQEHERLHHGQFIAYFTLAGFELPQAFRSNWAL